MINSEWNSKQENIIAQFLYQHDIPYIHEKVLFDLYTPDGGHPMMELEGLIIRTEFGKYQREITDPLKKWYCKKKRIPLYEIRYDEDTISRLIEILIEIGILEER